MKQSQLGSGIFPDMEQLITAPFDRRRLEQALYVVAAVSEIGRQMLHLRESGRLVERRKGDGSRVTNADFQAHDFFRERLPKIEDCQILSEESGNKGAGLAGSRLWIVDELDGTSSFCGGYPEFGPSVALQSGGELELGVAGLPAKGCALFAVRGLGAFRYDEKTHAVEIVRTRDPHGDFYEVSGFYHAARAIEIERLHSYLDIGFRQIRYHSVGALFKYCQVACGEADAAGGSRLLESWDIAASVLIVREAGGEVFDLDTGSPVVIDASRRAGYRIIAVGRKENFIS